MLYNTATPLLSYQTPGDLLYLSTECPKSFNAATFSNADSDIAFTIAKFWILIVKMEQ
jgi:hypothetical protein